MNTKVTAVLLMILLLFYHQVVPIGKSGTSPSALSPNDVSIFMCFRGSDTRDNVASLVHHALCSGGFDAFMDDESIGTGHSIEATILERIDKSMGAVVILSQDFASSEWCLDELVRIMEKKKKLGSGYVLHPIYVGGVDPDDVAELRGSYGKAIAKHKRRYYWSTNRIQKREWDDKVKLWTAALTEIASYKGKRMSGKWAPFITKIVEEVREEFTGLGIAVKPPPQYPDSSPAKKDQADGWLDTIYESIKKLAIVVSLFQENTWLLDNSFTGNVVVLLKELIGMGSLNSDVSMMMTGTTTIALLMIGLILILPVAAQGRRQGLARGAVLDS